MRFALCLPWRVLTPEAKSVMDRLNRRSAMVDECLVWLGPESGGYGTIYAFGRPRGVHIAAWMAMIGPVPEGLELDHRCEQPLCWNVSHLQAVTHEENSRLVQARRHARWVEWPEVE